MKLVNYLLAVIIFCGALFAQDNVWQIASQPDIEELMLDIFMVSETEGWIAGNNGHIFYTDNGFETFEKQISNTENNISALYFIDEDFGWAGTKKGEILRTEDGGKNWEKIDLGTLMDSGFSFSYLNSIYFVNKNLGFTIAGKSKNNFAFKTTDGGKTWLKCDSLITTSSSYWKDIRFYDENNGLIVGDKTGTHKYTMDGGDTWIEGDQNLVSNFNQSTVRYLSKDTLICAGEGNSFSMKSLPIYKSVDSGKTWQTIDISSYDRVKDIYFKDSKNGLAVGSNGFSKFFVLKTTDAGETWEEKFNDYSCGIQGISGIGNTIYLLGSSSHIFKSTDFGETFEMKGIKSPSTINDLKLAGNTGYAINTNGDLFKSTDAGLSWQYFNTTGIGDAYAMEVFDEQTGIILKTNRRIVKTTDGGLTWKTVLDSVTFSSRNKVGGLHFPTTQTGYAWMSINEYTENYVYKTTDAGDTWNEVAQLTSAGSIKGNIEFFDENNGIIGGPRIKIDGVYEHWLKYTTDGGITWVDSEIMLPDSIDAKDIRDIAILDDNTAFAAATNTLLKTTDKGQNWEVAETEIDDKVDGFYTVDFNGSNGAFADYDGTLAYTKDSGTTWIVDSTNTDINSVYKLEVTKDDKIFICHYGGFISLSGTRFTGIQEDPENENLPLNYSLGQNYPNPFNPSTNIKYSIAEDTDVELKLYNVLGSEVALLVDEYQSQGNYKFVLDTSKFNLSSGVYFYRLKTRNFTATGKMLLIK